MALWLVPLVASSARLFMLGADVAEVLQARPCLRRSTTKSRIRQRNSKEREQQPPTRLALKSTWTMPPPV